MIFFGRGVMSIFTFIMRLCPSFVLFMHPLVSYFFSQLILIHCRVVHVLEFILNTKCQGKIILIFY